MGKVLCWDHWKNKVSGKIDSRQLIVYNFFGRRERGKLTNKPKKKIKNSSSHLAKSIAPFLASEVLTMPSNLAKGLGSDTAGLFGGTGGPFLRPPLTLTWKLLVMRLIVELTLLLLLLLVLLFELSAMLEPACCLWEPRGIIVAVLEDIWNMMKKRMNIFIWNLGSQSFKIIPLMADLLQDT